MTCRIHSFIARFAAFVACACPLGVMAEGGTSALAATSGSRPPSSVIVATVNDEIITQADLDNAVAVSGARDTTVLRRTLRHRLIAMELLRQAAEKPRHVNATRGIRRASEASGIIEVIRQYLRDTVRPSAVTEADVWARYAQVIKSLETSTQRSTVSAETADRLLTAGRLTSFARRAAPDRDSVAPQANSEVRRNVSPPVNPSTPVSFADGTPGTPTTPGNEWGLREPDATGDRQIPSYDTLRDSIRTQLETERLDEAIRTVVDDLMTEADISE
ncbi:peptidylprolyl isomerase (plasmid) [Paraburkholderia hospita]|nr:peptidylprolyl isomerase [Paraburkholderia hospita]